MTRKHISKPKVLNATDRDHIRHKWAEVEQLVKLGQPSQLKQAVLEADKLLELCLKRLVSEEQSLGENLKQAKDLFSSWDDYQLAWKAHKVRNSLVHDSGYDLPHYVAREVIDIFRKVLHSLGAI